MAGAAPQIEWYLARDGQQYGPLSEAEMRKFIELAHLRPTDLVWRQGFAEWRPAAAIFPLRPAPPVAPARPPPGTEPRRAPEARQTTGQPKTQGAPAAGRSALPDRGAAGSAANREAPAKTALMPGPGAPLDEDAEDDSRTVRVGRAPGGRKRLMATLLVLLALSGAGWVGLQYRDRLGALTNIATSFQTQDSEPLKAPFQTSANSQESLDGALQKAALWKIIKAEFPEWYEERLREMLKIKTEQRGDAALTKYMAESVVILRRRHANLALSASPGSLKQVATSFLDNLRHLSSYSVEACYGFISQGEVSQAVLPLLVQPQHFAPMQKQVTAVFEAVAEGRKSPQTHSRPNKADYDTLAQALTSRGWAQADLELFSDPRALARAKPEQVCKMVQDWFAAQLSIPEPDAQLRLLVESLRPVVAG